jgi:hypothetical protein
MHQKHKWPMLGALALQRQEARGIIDTVSSTRVRRRCVEGFAQQNGLGCYFKVAPYSNTTHSLKHALSWVLMAGATPSHSGDMYKCGRGCA